MYDTEGEDISTTLRTLANGFQNAPLHTKYLRNSNMVLVIFRFFSSGDLIHAHDHSRVR